MTRAWEALVFVFDLETPMLDLDLEAPVLVNTTVILFNTTPSSQLIGP